MRWCSWASHCPSSHLDIPNPYTTYVISHFSNRNIWNFCASWNESTFHHLGWERHPTGWIWLQKQFIRSSQCLGFFHLNWLPTRRAQKPSHEHVGVQLLLGRRRTSSSGPFCVAAAGESRVAATPSTPTSLTLRLREPGSVPLAPPNSSRQVNFLREVVPRGRLVLVGRKEGRSACKVSFYKDKKKSRTSLLCEPPEVSEQKTPCFHVFYQNTPFINSAVDCTTGNNSACSLKTWCFHKVISKRTRKLRFSWRRGHWLIFCRQQNSQ